jgi:GTP-binding protein
MSAARPKVAAYPFTTLHPHLGVVAVGALQSFVMADIPGLIEGAAEGAGLGMQFLRHLERTRLLLHVVDIAPLDPENHPADQVRAIEQELAKFSKDLAAKPRWLVLNKVDLVAAEDLPAVRARLLEELGWEGAAREVSAATGAGTEQLARAVMRELTQVSQVEVEDEAEQRN